MPKDSGIDLFELLHFNFDNTSILTLEYKALSKKSFAEYKPQHLLYNVKIERILSS